jgi:ATP-dependent Lon protease
MTATSNDAEILTPALEAIPIFPLSGVVLFPGALLPLHVFEPRYRTMLADCLATSRCMAMAFALVDGDRVDLEGEPKIAQVAGAGLVVHHALLADGRSNIVLQGRARVWLDELPFAAPYRRARARVLDEIETAVSALDRTGLLAVATAFAKAAQKTEFVLPPGIGPGAAADLCAHQLVVDAQARQQALEELDIAARVHLVTDTLAEQMGRVNFGHGLGPRRTS